MYFILLRSCPVFVFVFGLVSCNQKSLTSLNVPEPTWETEAGPRPFNLNDSNGRELKITDQLELSGSPAAMLRSASTCIQASKPIVHIAQFKIPAKIPMFSFLPLDLLRPSSGEYHCSISFIAFSSEGASHSFSMKDVAIQNSTKPFGIERFEDSTTIVKSTNLGSTEFRLSTSDALEVRWLCEDFSISTQHGPHRDLNLREFRLPVDFVHGRTTQKCRLLGLENGRVTLLSDEFAFHFLGDIPTFETHVIATKGRSVFSPRDVALYSFRIVNNTPDYLRLRLPKTNIDKMLILWRINQNIIAPSICGNPLVAKGELRNLRFNVSQQNGTSKWSETAHYFQLELPIQSSVEGTISAQVTPSFGLFIPNQVLVFQPFEVQIFLGDDWQPTETIPWAITGKSTWAIDEGAFPNYPCGG